MEAAWRVVDPVLGDVTPVHPYAKGSWGPKEADRLLQGSDTWHDPAAERRRRSGRARCQGTRAARVVIVGGGFGGLFAARALRRGPVSVTLIDRAQHHLFQPLLYQCATGILSEGQIAVPLRRRAAASTRTSSA